MESGDEESAVADEDEVDSGEASCLGGKMEERRRVWVMRGN